MKMRKDRRKVLECSGEIARKFRGGGVTVAGMMREYRCGYDVMMEAVFLEMSLEEWGEIRKKSCKAGGDKRRKNTEKKEIKK